MGDRQHLMSVTKKDFRFDYFRGTGAGGQKRNKTSSGVRCTHIETGACGVSDETRSQHQNKALAFRKCVESDKFQRWLKIASLKRIGVLHDVDAIVNGLMKDANLKLEIKDENGRWKEVPYSTPLGDTQ